MIKKRFNLFSIVFVISASLLSFMAIAALGQPAISTPDATQQAVTAAVAPQPVSITPVSRPAASWQKRHNAMNERVKQGNADLLVIGDSITQGWEGAGKEVWNKFYKDRNAVNLGISGDQTQHVLWRLENGNIDGISPKLAMLMIGTNNANAKQTPEEVAEGVKAIVEKLREKLPQTKILVLGIFPRGADDQDSKRQTNMKANEIIAKLADDKMIFYLDINDKFLDPDRKLSKDIMPDLLHPNTKGYEIWAEAVEPTIAKLMGEK
ncbi:MAG: platelet-activating factor acetylhydrolase IB subunit [Thermoguttaceae bacterium]|jgi:beta-glucosidase